MIGSDVEGCVMSDAGWPTIDHTIATLLRQVNQCPIGATIGVPQFGHGADSGHSVVNDDVSHA
jgi:hypothetical protein